MTLRLLGLETSGVLMLVYRNRPCVKQPLGKLPLAVGQVLHTLVSLHPSVAAASLHSVLSRMSKWPYSSHVVP